MDTFKFSVTATGNQVIPAKGNFIRYKSVTNGAASSTIRVKTSNGDSLVMDPNDKVAQLPRAFDRIEVTNEDAAETIAGLLIIGEGDFDSAQITGSVTVTNSTANGTHAPDKKTVTNASGTLLAANSARKYLCIQNQDASGNIFIRCNGEAATADAECLKLAPGDVWEPLVAPTSELRAIGDIASNANVHVCEA